MIKFVLMISRSGKTCFARYFKHLEDRTALEIDLMCKIMDRKPSACSFFDYRDTKIVFRQYMTVFIIIGSDKYENELAVLEFIQLFVEILDSYFPKVSDFDITFNLEKVHMILQEMLSNGCISEMRKTHILAQLRLTDSQK